MQPLEADTSRAALDDIAHQLGLSLDLAALDRLIAYLRLLQRWNATYNLTAVRDPAQMVVQHLADCLAVVGPLRRQWGPEPAGRRILDVGSGGGLPGVVLAIADAGWEVVCVDTVGKKAAFVRQVAAELGLPRLRGEHARVEQLSAGRFDVVTSRAFASLPDFVALTRRHLGEGGCWMAMKGKRPDEEIAALPPEIDVFHVEQVSVPSLHAERCLVWMKPRA